MSKFQVGDMLYLVNTGINVRGNPLPPKYVEVTHVGRKYFTIDLYGGTKFHIDDLCEKTEYCSDWSLYESKEVYEERLIARIWADKFHAYFGGYGRTTYSLSQYEKAGEIFGITIDD